MPFIHDVTEDSAKGLLADLFVADRQDWGYLPNFATTFGLRPEVYQAWRHLNGALKASMDPRRYELTVRVDDRGCSHCLAVELLHARARAHPGPRNSCPTRRSSTWSLTRTPTRSLPLIAP